MTRKRRSPQEVLAEKLATLWRVAAALAQQQADEATAAQGTPREMAVARYLADEMGHDPEGNYDVAFDYANAEQRAHYLRHARALLAIADASVSSGAPRAEREETGK